MSAQQPAEPSEATPSRIIAAMERIVARHKLTVTILLHTVIFAVSLLVSFLVGIDLRESRDVQGWFVPQFLPVLPFFIVVKLIFFGQAKLLRGGWRYAGIRDVANILFASWLFTLVAFGCLFLFHYAPYWMDKVSIPYLGRYF